MQQIDDLSLVATTLLPHNRSHTLLHVLVTFTLTLTLTGFLQMLVVQSSRMMYLVKSAGSLSREITRIFVMDRANHWLFKHQVLKCQT